MIGTSLSGITFVSIPGVVLGGAFGYMQIVLGYFLGYMLITYILLPLYYRLQLVSIYSYLGDRIGPVAYKTGAFYFLVSRVAGASIRLLLVAGVFHQFVFKEWHFPFWLSVLISITLIWLYTNRGGVKTIVWTDSLQTLFMLIALVLTIIVLIQQIGDPFGEVFAELKENGSMQVFFTNDFKSKNYFLKEILGGMLIAFCMTGLDQDMMQKNLSCKNLPEAQKNVITFSVTLVFVNLLFLFLGALLYYYATTMNVALPGDETVATDQVFPFMALKVIGHPAVALFFILGLIAAAYSSADSAITSLTTSVCYDFLDIKKKDERTQLKLRRGIHILVSLFVFIVILFFHEFLNRSAIDRVLFVGSLTYGPLLGLFLFGIATNRNTNDIMVPVICLLSPVFTYVLVTYSPEWFNGYQFHYEALGVNGLLTFLLLFLFSTKPKHKDKN